MEYQIPLLFFLFLFSGFFSSAEAALFSLTPLHQHKMAADRMPFLQSVKALLENPRRLLVTIIVGNEAVNIGLSVLMSSLCLFLFGRHGEWVAVAVTTPLLLVFTEALPKTLGVTRPLWIAAFAAPPLAFLARFLRPLAWLLEAVSGWIASLLPGGEVAEKGILTEHVLRTLIDAGQEEGVLEPTQRDLIHKAFELGDKPVADVMVPRVEIFSLPANLSLREMEKRIVAARHAKAPVYGSDPDDILGILHVRDLFREILRGNKDVSVASLARKPYFVPEERTAGSVLKDFQARHIQMALVVDEYGGIAGLVTMQDILEELLDDVYGEYNLRETLWQRIDDDTLMVSGRMPIDDFQALTGLPPVGEEVETVGGLVLHLFGALPAVGDEVSWENRRFQVERIRGARIAKVRVTKDAEAGLA